MVVVVMMVDEEGLLLFGLLDRGIGTMAIRLLGGAERLDDLNVSDGGGGCHCVN